MAKVRVSMHSGHGCRRHNDHDKKKGETNIDYSRTPDNFIWTAADNRKAGLKYSIAEGEIKVYERLYGGALEAQNERYRKKGNYDRIRTMEEWASARQHEPTEVILQVGNKDNFAEACDRDTLHHAVIDFVNWKQKRFKGNYALVSVAGHYDEATPHYHVRECWFSHDTAGNRVPGIKAAMREMGVPLPDPSKPEGKDNYRKAVIDAECREKWQEICIHYGIDVETVPDRTRKQGHMGVDAYKEYSGAMAKLEEGKAALDAREDALKAQEAASKKQAEAAAAQLQKASEIASKAQKLLQQAEAMPSEDEVLQAFLDARNKSGTTMRQYYDRFAAGYRSKRRDASQSVRDLQRKIDISGIQQPSSAKGGLEF